MVMLRLCVTLKIKQMLGNYHTYVLISGTSSGLGRALAEEWLSMEGVLVEGLSRRSTIEHPRYVHQFVDLSDERQILNLKINFPKGIQRAVLINNAGTINPVGTIDAVDSSSVAAHFRLNILAVYSLMQYFLINHPKGALPHIVNISSGAGSYPVRGWAAYCASKSAVDAMTKVVAEEHPDIPVWSLAPGIVDTDMQMQIRDSDPNTFPEHQRFVDYHKNGSLITPTRIAQKINELIRNPERIQQPVFSIRDYL